MLINYKEYEYNMNIVNRSSYSDNNEQIMTLGL